MHLEIANLDNNRRFGMRHGRLALGLCRQQGLKFADNTEAHLPVGTPPGRAHSFRKTISNISFFNIID